MFFLTRFILGVRKEIKRIRWISIDEVWPKSFKILLFCLVFFVFFLSLDSLITWFLKWLEIDQPVEEVTLILKGKIYGS